MIVLTDRDILRT